LNLFSVYILKKIKLTLFLFYKKKKCIEYVLIHKKMLLALITVFKFFSSSISMYFNKNLIFNWSNYTDKKNINFIIFKYY